MGFKENLRKQYLNKEGKKRGFWSWLWNNPFLFFILALSLFMGFIGRSIPALLVLYLMYWIFRTIAFSNKKRKK